MPRKKPPPAPSETYAARKARGRKQVTITLSPEADEELRRRAKASNQTLSATVEAWLMEDDQ